MINFNKIKDVYIEEKKINWIKHPKFEGVFIKYLLTKKFNDSSITCLLVKTPKGVSIPQHIHEGKQDIIYPLQGNGKIYIEGKGEFPYIPGVCIVVPKDTPHYVYDVKETLLAFDIFNPALI